MPSPPELTDIWARLSVLMNHLQGLRMDEAAVQAQQLDALRDGNLLLPSPFHDNGGDGCCRSWYHEHQFYLEFESGAFGRYFVVTGLLDRGYSLDTIWFPDRGLAVTIYASQIDAGRLERFAAALPGMAKTASAAALVDRPRTVVVGFTHMIHMLWNELPGLQNLAAQPVPAALDLAVLFEPFGPIAELFPELAGLIQRVRYEDMPRINREHFLVLGLGSWTIPAKLQQSIAALSQRLVSPAVIERRDQFRDAHRHRFWLSVKPPKRTVDRQAEQLAELIAMLDERYPDSGYILDGASLPWDYPANPNYHSWMHDNLDGAATRSADVIGDVVQRLTPALQARTVVLNGVPAPETVVWGAAASFYICHGGTMQNKIGWLQRIPGFIHSNQAFLHSARTMPPPVQDCPPCFYASAALIEDDAAGEYSELELARKDQNYRFTSSQLFLDEVSAAIAASAA